MSLSVSHLLSEALQLSADSRTELVEAILEQSRPSAKFVDNQLALVRTRREDVLHGKSTLIPAVEAHALVRNSFHAAE